MVNKIYNDVQRLKKPKTRSLEEININAYRVPNYASLKFGEEGGWENIKEDCFVWRGEGQGRWQLLSRTWGGVLRAEAACHSLLGPEESSELRGESGPLVLRPPSPCLQILWCPGGPTGGKETPGTPQGSSLLETGGHRCAPRQPGTKTVPQWTPSSLCTPSLGAASPSRPFCFLCDTQLTLLIQSAE